ncbi:MAG: prenyltransferase/squalene oxidase repeat-containing protein [Flavobacteriales bacterium]
MLKSHMRPFGVGGPHDRKAALSDAIAYLLRAQKRGDDAGMGSFHLVKGWGASYPETTGYAVPTLIAAGEHLGIQQPLDAAVQASEWLLTIQRPDGGWQGGRVGEGRPSIVFNTAQVVRGMLAVHELTKDERFLSAAVRAARWIASVQDGDGAWRSSNFLGVGRVYDTYVDAPLLRVHALTGDPALKQAAARNLDWVLEQRTPNGWFKNADNTVKHNDRPITHTIAYTLDGLLECAEILGRADLAEAGTVPARVLLDRFLANEALNGRYDAAWKGSEYPLMTGCAQLAITWAIVFERSGEPEFRTGLLRMVDALMMVQAASANGPSDVRGAMPGSYPLWGRYEKFAFPNWATKYFADAVLRAERIDKVE